MSKDYGYARFWAGALTALGTLFVLIGFLAAVAAILIPTIGGLFPSRGNDVLAGVVMAILAVLAAGLGQRNQAAVMTRRARARRGPPRSEAP